jgi:nitrogen-specific signal transduction histidine kinase
MYNHIVEPCYSKPVPSDVVKCVRTVADNTNRVEGLVKKLQTMAQELSEHGFEIHRVLEGAEAYWSKVENNAKSYIRIHLSPRTSILQFQVEAEPMILVKIARAQTKLVG